jgi:hypothetical protein
LTLQIYYGPKTVYDLQPQSWSQQDVVYMPGPHQNLLVCQKSRLQIILDYEPEHIKAHYDFTFTRR